VSVHGGALPSTWTTGLCGSGKREFLTRADAKRARKSLKAAGGGRQSGLSEYLCGDCNLWHVGHLPPHVRRGLSARGDFY